MTHPVKNTLGHEAYIFIWNHLKEARSLLFWIGFGFGALMAWTCLCTSRLVLWAFLSWPQDNPTPTYHLLSPACLLKVGSFSSLWLQWIALGLVFVPLLFPMDKNEWINKKEWMNEIILFTLYTAHPYLDFWTQTWLGCSSCLFWPSSWVSQGNLKITVSNGTPELPFQLCLPQLNPKLWSS